MKAFLWKGFLGGLFCFSVCLMAVGVAGDGGVWYAVVGAAAGGVLMAIILARDE